MFPYVITLYESFYWEHSHYPSLPQLLSYLKSDDSWPLELSYPTIKELKALLLSPQFDTACRARGLTSPTTSSLSFQALNLHLLQPSKERKSLTPDQLAAGATFLNLNDRRSLTTKLKEIGYTTKQWQVWLRDPNFKTFLEQELAKRFDLVDFDARASLSHSVQGGDLNAIKFYYELTGKYKPNSETIINLGIIVAQMMEILSEFLTAQALSQVAERFETVLQSNTLANAAQLSRDRHILETPLNT